MMSQDVMTPEGQMLFPEMSMMDDLAFPAEIVSMPEEPKKKTADVAIGYLYSDYVSSGFHGSLLQAIWYDQHAHGRVGSILPIHSGVNISGPRNDLVRAFLNTDQEWLLMIDSDMVFPADTIDRLLEHADVENVPVLGALCFGQAKPEGGVPSPIAVPTLYAWMRDETSNDLNMMRMNDYPDDTLIRVDATGAAFLLVHREVFKHVRTPEYEPFPWFSEGAVNGRYVGEDISFFLRLRDKVPVHVHTGVKISHQKTWLVNEAVYKLQRESDWPLPGGVAQFPNGSPTAEDQETETDDE